MNTHKNTARIVGILYIIGTVAGVLSVVFRGALETVTYMATVIGWLFLIKLSQVYVQADAPDASNPPVIAAGSA